MQIETVCPSCQKYITVDLDGHIIIVPQQQAVAISRKCTVCKKPLAITVTITPEEKP